MLVTLGTLRVKGPFRVKFRQGTWPWNSDIRLDEMATNDIKMGQIATGAWPTPTSSPGRFSLASKPRKSAPGRGWAYSSKRPKRPYLKFRAGTHVPPPPLLRGSQILPSTAWPFSPNLSLHWIRFKYGLISLISTSSSKRRLLAEVPRTYNWRGEGGCHPPLRFFCVFFLDNKH